MHLTAFVYQLGVCDETRKGIGSRLPGLPCHATRRDREAAEGMPEPCRTSLGLQKKNLILCLRIMNRPNDDDGRDLRIERDRQERPQLTDTPWQAWNRHEIQYSTYLT